MKASNRTYAAWRWGHLYQRIDNEGICAYCGDVADTLDHFLPLTRGGLCRGGHFLIDCCRSCNSLLRDVVFKTIDEKIFFIKTRLYPAGLDHLLEDEALWISKNEKKQKLLQRVIWTNQDNPARAQLAEIRLVLPDTGKNFVLPDVVTAIIAKKELLQLSHGARTAKQKNHKPDKHQSAVQAWLERPGVYVKKDMGSCECQRCGRVVRRKRWRQRYCSASCRVSAWQKRAGYKNASRKLSAAETQGSVGRT